MLTRLGLLPPSNRRFLGDLAALLGGQLLGAGKTPLLAAQTTEGNGGGILAVRGRGINWYRHIGGMIGRLIDAFLIASGLFA
jgi:hypothetical protein